MSEAFSDFSKLKLHLPSLRVDDLKDILRGINRTIPGAYTRLTGRKDDLVMRIEDQLLDAIQTSSKERYNTIRTLIFPRRTAPPAQTTQPRPSNIAIPPMPSSSNHQYPPHPLNSIPNRAPAQVTDYGSTSMSSRNAFPNPPSSSSSSAGFKRSLPPAPHHPSFGTTNALVSTARAQLAADSHSKYIPLPFEGSPFYRFDSAASGIAVCHTAQNDRKQVSLTLTLSSEQKTKLTQSQTNSSNSQYRLRLFCTSENHYNHPQLTSPQAPVLPPAPTEFPTTCELKLNSMTISANVRGLKNQPGTAPPPDLSTTGNGSLINMKEYGMNRVDVIYTNTDRKYYAIVYLVEHFSIPLLIKNLKASKQQTQEEVLAKIKAGSGDDDVFTSSSVVALVDPLVLSRIRLPIRSLQCTHLQCFDAEFFYSMMEQTSTWMCPVCNKKLNPQQLAIDGYMQSILQITPSSIDSVIIEADGTWHDENYKYGTSPQVGIKKPSSSSTSTEKKENLNEKSKVNSNKRDVMVLEIDDDDDNDGRNGNGRKRVKSNQSHLDSVCIDLTLDDD
ncbi:PINIT domain-containing protein [Melampsora americana]|nr:PINIT domain-containing protein [Melampsora americana]